jgi:hypothetical protein
VTHTLRNDGRWSVELAPWAISMCRTGGMALLPQPRERTDPDGFLPNRRFSFWPYSDVTDTRLRLGNQITLVHAAPGPNNKIGYRNTHGWFAYWLDGLLFSKHFDPRLDGTHPDQGCNAEFFFAQDVIELGHAPGDLAPARGRVAGPHRSRRRGAGRRAQAVVTSQSPPTVRSL